jgi:uncharacterized membrane protein
VTPELVYFSEREISVHQQKEVTALVSESPHPSISRARIEDLSDLIFGLALSIGAIELVVSTSAGTLTNTEIDYAVAGFGFNFLILISVWTHYTSITSVVPIQTEIMRRLNMALLFMVAIEPYFLNILVSPITAPSISQNVSAYYALDIGCMNLILGYFVYQMTVEKNKLIPKELFQKYRVSTGVTIAQGILFLISAVPVFWTVRLGGVELRFILWILSFPLAWPSRLSEHIKKQRPKERAES